MRNRAKCKKCKSLLESFHEFDYVECECKEISISGGNVRFECYARDFSNFLRVDDLGMEIRVKIKDEKICEEVLESVENMEKEKPKREELLEMLSNLIENMETLPPQAMSANVTHYDMWSALKIIEAILKKM